MSTSPTCTVDNPSKSQNVIFVTDITIVDQAKKNFEDIITFTT